LFYYFWFPLIEILFFLLSVESESPHLDNLCCLNV